MAKIIQEAIDSKEGKYDGLNNSHIVIFDIHSEYKTAFPKANMIDVNNLVLPYWLLNSDELQEMFLDTEANDYNQRNVFKQSVVDSRKNHFTGDEEQKKLIHFDSPLYFDIDDVLKTAIAKNEERINNGNKAGPLNGKLSNYISRLENKLQDKRLDFLIGENTKNAKF